MCIRDRLTDFSAHILRHTAATRWLRAGADVVVVAGLLGHSSLDTNSDVHQRPRPTDRDLAAAVEAGAVGSSTSPAVRTPDRLPAGPGSHRGRSRTGRPRRRRARPPPARTPGTAPGPHSPCRWPSRPAIVAARPPVPTVRPAPRGPLSVSYTHLTLPTKRIV